MDSGYDSVADSVATTLGSDPSAKAAWITDSSSWDAKLVTPFVARVRSGLGIQAVPGPALRARIGRILAGQTATQRWGPQAGEDFLIANDADIRAALSEFPHLPTLLLVGTNTR